MVHLPDRPIRETADFESYQDRRQFLSRAAIGIASASARRPVLHAAGFGGGKRCNSSLPHQNSRRRNLSTCANAYWRRAGRIAKRSPIRPRACSSRRCSNSRSYWAAEYDWRRIEARLNALPQFVTEIDGLDIHFIHVRSKHDNALPMIVTHGWPGSIIEQMKIIDPLTNPTAHGGSASDAFHLVIPSLPGHGFSGKPTAPGWTPVSIARAWATLMQRLGYTRYVAQGGDWGNAVSEVMALQQPPGLLGIHTNMAATVPADVSKAAFGWGPAARRPLGR